MICTTVILECNHRIGKRFWNNILHDKGSSTRDHSNPIQSRLKGKHMSVN